MPDPRRREWNLLWTCEFVHLERTNGTYQWNVSVPGPTPYVISPASASSLTVGGMPDQVQLTFTQLPGTHFIQHVVVIFLENEPLSSVKSDGPYEDYLAANYEAASRWFAPCHPSAPEYLSVIAATTNQCGSDAYPGTAGNPTTGGGPLGSYRNVTLADLLQNSTLGPGGRNFTWADYAENLPPNACTDPAKYDRTGLAKSGYGLFVSKHVPFLYEADTVYEKAFCQNHILSLEPGGSVNDLSFNASVAAGTMANFSFISPNICDDGHSPCKGIAKCDVYRQPVLGSVRESRMGCQSSEAGHHAPSRRLARSVPKRLDQRNRPVRLRARP